MKTLLCILFLSLGANSAKAQTNISEIGKTIFEHKCQRCHGSDGTKGLFGAKNLQVSNLANTELITIISKGRRGMPRWEKKLSQAAIESVAAYVKSLRK